MARGEVAFRINHPAERRGNVVEIVIVNIAHIVGRREREQPLFKER